MTVSYSLLSDFALFYTNKTFPAGEWLQKIKNRFFRLLAGDKTVRQNSGI